MRHPSPLYQPSPVPRRPLLDWRLFVGGVFLAAVLLPLGIALAWELDGFMHPVPPAPTEESAP